MIVLRQLQYWEVADLSELCKKDVTFNGVTKHIEEMAKECFKYDFELFVDHYKDDMEAEGVLDDKQWDFFLDGSPLEDQCNNTERLLERIIEVMEIPAAVYHVENLSVGEMIYCSISQVVPTTKKAVHEIIMQYVEQEAVLPELVADHVMNILERREKS